MRARPPRPRPAQRWRLAALAAGWLLGCGCAPSPEPAANAPTAAATRPTTQPTTPPTASPPADPVPSTAGHRVRALSITVLSTTKAPRGTGEWGFAALVEADGERILFDTGEKRRTVLSNAELLGVDLRTVPTVVLSHHHDDHVGGLLTLRQAVIGDAPEALSTVHVGRGMFEPRRFGAKAKEVNAMLGMRPTFEATGGRFVVHDGPAEIAPGVWVTGPVPRVHEERNWGTSRRLRTAHGWGEDTLPESQSLVFDTEQGLVVLSGCGHAGIVNIVTYARDAIRSAPLHAAVGGFHLHQASDDHLAWTGAQLQAVGLQHFEGAHCTGEPAVQRFAELSTVAPDGSRELVVGDAFVLEH